MKKMMVMYVDVRVHSPVYAGVLGLSIKGKCTHKGHQFSPVMITLVHTLPYGVVTRLLISR